MGGQREGVRETRREGDTRWRLTAEKLQKRWARQGQGGESTARVVWLLEPSSAGSPASKPHCHPGARTVLGPRPHLRSRPRPPTAVKHEGTCPAISSCLPRACLAHAHAVALCMCCLVCCHLAHAHAVALWVALSICAVPSYTFGARACERSLLACGVCMWGPLLWRGSL